MKARNVAEYTPAIQFNLSCKDIPIHKTKRNGRRRKREFAALRALIAVVLTYS